MIITLILIVAVGLFALVLFGTLIQILAALVVGFIAGLVARFIIPGEQYMPWWQTVLIGVAGSIVSGLVGALVGVGSFGILGSILGAVGVLYVLGKMRASGIIGLVLAASILSGCAGVGIDQQRSGSPREASWSVYPWGEMMSVPSTGGEAVPWYSPAGKEGAIGVAGKVACW